MKKRQLRCFVKTSSVVGAYNVIFAGFQSVSVELGLAGAGPGL